jgi:hypothetical protein
VLASASAGHERDVVRPGAQRHLLPERQQFGTAIGATDAEPHRAALDDDAADVFGKRLQNHAVDGERLPGVRVGAVGTGLKLQPVVHHRCLPGRRVERPAAADCREAWVGDVDAARVERRAHHAVVVAVDHSQLQVGEFQHEAIGGAGDEGNAFPARRACCLSYLAEAGPEERLAHRVGLPVLLLVGRQPHALKVDAVLFVPVDDPHIEGV